MAARPRRGTRLLRGHPAQERTPAAAAACPGAERHRLRPLRVRGPGHSAAAPGAEPAAVPPGRGHAGRSHDGSHAGSPPGIAAPGRAGQRAARTDARPAAGGRQRPARRTRACTAPAGRGARVQFPRPDPAQPGRSRPRSAAVHRGPERGPQRAGPVHHPRLALRPGAQQPGTGRSDRRGGTPAGRGVAVGRGQGRTKRRLLPRGARRGRHRGRTTSSAPCVCSPPQARSCKPRAAAGCTRSCPAPPTTMISWPRCAPAWEMRHSSRPGHGASPWEAAAPLSTR